MIAVCNKMYGKEYIYYITNRFPVQGKFMIGYAKPQLTSDTHKTAEGGMLSAVR